VAVPPARAQAAPQDGATRPFRIKVLHIVGLTAHANARMRIAEYFGVPVEVIFAACDSHILGQSGKLRKSR
jgi:hypothetical protein